VVENGRLRRDLKRAGARKLGISFVEVASCTSRRRELRTAGQVMMAVMMVQEKEMMN
jgi:hypothetical protein